MASERRRPALRPVFVAMLLGLCVPLVTERAAGQSLEASKNAARELAIAGHDHLQRGEYREAAGKFRRAHELFPAPTISLDLGKALVELGQYVEAAEAFIATQRTKLKPGDSGVFQVALEEAGRQLAELKPRIPRLEIVVEGAADASVEVTLNGVVIPAALVGVNRNVNPGRQEIIATSSTGATARETIELKDGEQRSVKLKLAGGTQSRHGIRDTGQPSGSFKATTSADEGSNGGTLQRTLGWIGLGVGAAALTVGLVADVAAANKHSEVERLCPGDVCIRGSAGEDELDGFRRLRTVSVVGYATGAAAAAAGLTLLLTAPEPGAGRDGRASAWLGLGTAGVRGTF